MPILHIYEPGTEGAGKGGKLPNPNYVTPKEGKVVGFRADFTTGEIADWIFKNGEVIERPRK